HFDEADRYGLPVKDANGNSVRLHLIPSPEDRLPEERDKLSQEEMLPSFLLYHYAQPGDAQPENLLGEENSTVLARPANPNFAHQEAAFSYDLVPFGILIIKTYTLDEKNYHIGLSVRFEHIPGGVEPPAGFRYQIASGHGLPIEGEWYTSTFRNSIFGWLQGS